MNKQGFTLVELLIYVSIVGLVSVSLVNFVTTVSQIRSKNAVVIEVHENVRAAVDIMSDYVRRASALDVSGSTFGTDPGVLSLNMSSTTIDPTQFFLNYDNGQLQVSQAGAGTTSIVSDEIRISNFTLTNIPGRGKARIRVEITAEYAKDPTIEYQYSQSITTTFRLRR